MRVLKKTSKVRRVYNASRAIRSTIAVDLDLVDCKIAVSADRSLVNVIGATKGEKAVGDAHHLRHGLAPPKSLHLEGPIDAVDTLTRRQDLAREHVIKTGAFEYAERQIRVGLIGQN